MIGAEGAEVTGPRREARSRRRASVAVVVGVVALSAALLPFVTLFGLRWVPPWPFLLVGALGAPGVAVGAGAFAVVTARGEPAHRLVGGGVALGGVGVLAVWATFAGLVLLWVSGGLPIPD